MNEQVRRILKADIDAEALSLSKEGIVAKYGQLWDTRELQEDYTVEGFLAPFVSVVRKKDNAKGLLMFSHHSRYYHSFKPVDNLPDTSIRIG